MFKKVLVAAAILIANPAWVSAQDIFWSFSPTEANPTSYVQRPGVNFGSAYIFSDGLFGFDSIDLNFTMSKSDVVRFTGGEAFNPTLNFVGGTRFDSSVISIDSSGNSGNLLSMNITQNGVLPFISETFDPGFEAGVGFYGAVLLARVDFEFVRGGGGDVEFEFTLGTQGAVQLGFRNPENPPITILDPTFGSGSLSSFLAFTLSTCIGDVNQSGNILNDVSDHGVDFFDIAPFILVLSSGVYQQEADCNQDGFVDFLDILPFIEILANPCDLGLE